MAATKGAAAVAAAEKAATREEAAEKAAVAGAEWACSSSGSSRGDSSSGWGSRQGSSNGGRWRMAEADGRCRNLGLVCGETDMGQSTRLLRDCSHKSIQVRQIIVFDPLPNMAY